MHQLDDELGDISSKISDREFSITDEVLFKLFFDHFRRRTRSFLTLLLFQVRLKVLTFHVEILAACSHAAILDVLFLLYPSPHSTFDPCISISYSCCCP
jgi:hypothetical protein